MSGHYTMAGQLGDWTFWAWDGHPFTGENEGRTLYAYEPVSNPGDVVKPNTGEWFTSLDRAMIAAVGEKYSGKRGAGGEGVGTAADWFARMIGMDSFTPISVRDQRKVMGEAIVATQRHDGPIYRRANAMVDELAKRGLVISTMNDGA
jgi:hypothetical protein